ncbi:hypothetical protein GCM10025876_31740 [Demequina litorisediminis]|uniref:Uncharacterized protein n=1 Tax=Demequina litorisediminis TaxID=1849022 RepID=A0ABQ6IGE7_9MICO|nr:hypothetical protein GCM10025876_31740 [Demequina litorisediminis]
MTPPTTSTVTVTAATGAAIHHRRDAPERDGREERDPRAKRVSRTSLAAAVPAGAAADVGDGALCVAGAAGE